MSHFPILQEMLESNSVIFAVVGLILGRAVGMKLRTPKRNLIAALISGAVYAVCEVLEQHPASYAMGIALLGVGTVAVGATVALIISAVIEKVRSKGEKQ